MVNGFKHNVNYMASDGSFHFHHARDERPNPDHFRLHYEKGYEIYMFISGSGSFNIEGSVYGLEPYSVLIINSQELHVLNISGQLPYERVVLTINANFLPPFMLNGVDLFRRMKFRKPGHDNRIKAETVISSGLLELFTKLHKLLSVKSAENEVVAKCVLVEILATINNLPGTDLPGPKGGTNDKVSEILDYIKSHLEEPLTLDSLSEKFYVTKYHLCHIFKEATGCTINQYITYKRIRLADGLMQEGHTPTQACFMSGFNCYSNFYKAYRKLTGRSPRSGS